MMLKIILHAIHPKINFYAAVCGYYHSFIKLASNDVLMLSNLARVINILLVVKK